MAGPEPDHYRLSDDERDQALERLRTALEEGRLDFDEHEARSTTALNAVTNLDLVPLFEDLPARLRPGSVTGTADTAPATRGSAPVERGAAEHGKVDRKDRGPNLGGLIGWSGFLFLVWGLPAIMSGNVTSIAVFFGFFFLLVVPGLTTVIMRRRRGGGSGELGSG
ncbi:MULTISPECIES: DUF1707 SHOCT-like domain-containing protein [Nocardiopsis]|uniref:DUF1707 domain-containing protein n=1 Tax=Nocardiopsis sinuspersici TaxID=501010 RepID=A0A1V3C7V1_9ACTN|nr:MULTISPECIES: DUF1707 domain-containing protein [Nocardiopsis]NYH53512.1 hypothetical protein [Nocardiopsis sinuspersici]OOC56831.1 hypothetical protein NOSIN_25835 [Nocardiopsis sinuspersici]